MNQSFLATWAMRLFLLNFFIRQSWLICLILSETCSSGVWRCFKLPSLKIPFSRLKINGCSRWISDFCGQKASVQRLILGPRPTLQQWKKRSLFMKGQYYFDFPLLQCYRVEGLPKTNCYCVVSQSASSLVQSFGNILLGGSSHDF